MRFGVRGGFARLIPLSGPAANSGNESRQCHHDDMSAACYNLKTHYTYSIYSAQLLLPALLAAEWNREREHFYIMLFAGGILLF